MSSVTEILSKNCPYIKITKDLMNAFVEICNEQIIECSKKLPEGSHFNKLILGTRNIMNKETFKCKGCGTECEDYCLRTPMYCYLCDPNITLEECLSEKPIEKRNRKNS